MKNILLLVHDDAGQEARFQAALDITRAIGGHLKCLDVTPLNILPIDAYGAGLAADGGALVLDFERQQESANKARLQQRLAVEDVSWDWADTVGVMEQAIEENAALADLIVVNRRIDDFPLPDMRHVASQLVVESGVPVLAVPQDATGFVAGRALVAWDGSHEAVSALTAAIPLLELAGSVTILEVDDGSVQTPAEEAAAYLSRHGLRAEIVRSGHGHASASDVIMAKAESGRFDYLVMGGFGHSRFVEACLGGVTRKMLTSSPIPLFLAR